MDYEFDIFISHSSSDTLQARLIRGYMRSHNLNCWLDQHDLATSEAIDDRNISKKVESALRKSRFLLIVLSEEALHSDWVKAEVEYAQGLQRGDHPELGIVAITVEELDLTEKPSWLGPVRVIQIGGALGKIDVLRELRDEIGEPKPTYMSSVEPSFVKQTPVSRLTDHLRKCEFDLIKIWFINGGFSIAQYIQPAIRTALQRKADQKSHVRAQVMFLDTADLDGNALPPELQDKDAQKFFDARLRLSEFFTKPGDHPQLLKETIESFAKLDSRFENFSAEFRLSPKIPAGRIVIAGKYGFFSPFIQEFDVDLPVLIFDDKSPFFETTERYFDEAFEDARALPAL